MFNPAAFESDAVLKAIFAAMLFAMAGGFPCCCGAEAGSTIPGSTSTSSPPLPPLPPGSTSTSTAEPPLPPKRSSSVGPIVRFECGACIAAETLLADQWQIEIVGVAADDCNCTDVDGAYIVEGITDGGYAVASGAFDEIGCGIELSPEGAEGSGGGGFCPDTDLYIWFLAAGWRVYTTYTPDRFFALTKVIVNLRNDALAYSHALNFEHWWDGNPDIDQTTGYTAGEAQVPCQSALPGLSIDCVDREGVGGGFTRCAVSGTATCFEVEGF